MTQALWSHTELLRNLVVREIHLSYRRMGLGILWTFLNPLALILIYFLAFRFVLGVNPKPDYALFLTVGVLHWDLFNRIVVRSTEAVVANAQLIDKIAFPRIVLPASIAVAEIVQHTFVLGAFALFFVPLGGRLWPGLVLYVPVLALGWAFCLGLAMALSALTVVSRDLVHLVNIAMRVGFFVSPVIYDFSNLSAAWQRILLANPFAAYLHALRDVLYSQKVPDATLWALMLAWALVAVVAGRAVFLRLQGRFTEWL